MDTRDGNWGVGGDQVRQERQLYKVGLAGASHRSRKHKQGDTCTTEGRMAGEGCASGA